MSNLNFAYDLLDLESGEAGLAAVRRERDELLTAARRRLTARGGAWFRRPDHEAGYHVPRSTGVERRRAQHPIKLDWIHPFRQLGVPFGRERSTTEGDERFCYLLATGTESSLIAPVTTRGGNPARKLSIPLAPEQGVFYFRSVDGTRTGYVYRGIWSVNSSDFKAERTPLASCGSPFREQVRAFLGGG